MRSNSDETLGQYISSSLISIKEASVELGDASDAYDTPAEIASRIKLCNLLLCEISCVRRNLARRLTYRPSTPAAEAAERTAQH